MNKYIPVLNFFIEKPISFIAFFFSIIPFWVVYLWHIKSNGNALVSLTFLLIIFLGRCIIDSEVTFKNPFNIMIDKLIYYTLWITGNILFFILILILTFFIIIIDDTFLKLTIFGIIIMSFSSLFIIKYNNSFRNIWNSYNIPLNKSSIFVNLSIFISWLIFIFVEPIYMKYVAVFIITILEISLFIKKYDSII